MWFRLYSVLVLPLLWLGFHVLALVNRKVRRGLRGRRLERVSLPRALEARGSRPLLWIHVSSMGEFEQAKPIIETLRQLEPSLYVVASFFSPSGYENSLRYPHADCIAYIPFDTWRAAKRFLRLLGPTAAVFVRYDIWPNHVRACAEMSVPVLLVNATMRASSPRRWAVLRPFHHAVFSVFRAILAISDEDVQHFGAFRLEGTRVEAVGDTRFDRVMGKALTARKKQLLPVSLAMGRRVLVAGSIWQEDADMLLPVIAALLKHDSSLLCILVPHEPTEEHLESLEYRLRPGTPSLRFSWLSQYNGERVIIVDSIGILLALYASADVAFVGGGFRSNVHNTLEPAAYGIPVVYGPKVDNSREAVDLRDAGGSLIVHSRRELYRALRRLLTDNAARTAMGSAAGSFVRERAGATERIVEALYPLLR